MENFDPAVAHYRTLNLKSRSPLRYFFTQVVRFDMRIIHPLYDEETDTRCDIWLAMEGNQTDSHQLRITLHGVRVDNFQAIRPGTSIDLDVKLITDRYWEHLRYAFFAWQDKEAPFEILYCRTFEARIEEVPFE